MLRPLAVLALLIAFALAACGDDDGASPSAARSVAPSLTAPATPELRLEDACPSAVVLDKGEGDGPAQLSLGWEDGGIICWLDVAGETAFRVRGSVDYWLPPPTWKCDEPPPVWTPLADLITSPAPEPNFLWDLPANTTRFQLPKHPDSRMGIKDYDIRVEALDADGNVIAFGGTTVYADAFCE